VTPLADFDDDRRRAFTPTHPIRRQFSAAIVKVQRELHAAPLYRFFGLRFTKGHHDAGSPKTAAITPAPPIEGAPRRRPMRYRS
jgi:hypothetical protein